MIDVTESAKREMRRLLDISTNWPEARLRLVDRGGGVLGLGIDIEMPGDLVVEHEGRSILVIESGLDSRLQRTTIDADENPDGAELVIIEEAAAAVPA